MRKPLLTIFLLLSVVLTVATAWPHFSEEMMGANPEVIWSRFDHAQHASAFKRLGMTCIACHEIGATVATPLNVGEEHELIAVPPKGACHFCHNPPEGDAANGPSRCAACHDAVAEPASHGAGWMVTHGADARLEVSACRDCHPVSSCVNCHTRNETASYQVHDRTWIAVHGISAMTDPATCGTCHLQSSCMACHRDAYGRAP